jgi:hypothetical protein
MRRVDDFEVKLGGVELARVVGDRHRGIGRRRHNAKPRRQFGDAVAMAHPDRIFFTAAPDFPIYSQRLSFFPEHEAVAELFLSLK